MRKQFVYTLVSVVALATTLVLVASRAQASVKGDSISINFGANEPAPGGSALPPAAVAGVPEVESANWNNALTEIGSLDNLVRDIEGEVSSASASVIWSATNTWCNVGCGGESNNNFVGNDRTLMSGYLDQNCDPCTIMVGISNLPDDYATYDVYVYFLGGVPDRGGTYTVNGATKFGVTGGNTGCGEDGLAPCNGPNYVEHPGENRMQKGNYLVFRGLSGNISISVNNDCADGPPCFRAPINAVEIVNTSE